MQGILQKHEKDNQLLAEKLVAFKQQITEADSFKHENQKYKGLRWTSFGKSEATLYFSEESKGGNSGDFYIILEYGSGRAFKINLEQLDEFYIVEGTHQV